MYLMFGETNTGHTFGRITSCHLQF